MESSAVQNDPDLITSDASPSDTSATSSAASVVGDLIVCVADAWSPLHYAAKNGLLDMLESILNQGPSTVNVPYLAEGKYWRTPLMLAAEHGHTACIKILLQSDADPDFKSKNDNWKYVTALHLAIRNCHSDCVELLLPKMNLQSLIESCSPLNKLELEKDENFLNPVLLALEKQDYDSLKLLLDYGFSPDSAHIATDLFIGLLSPVDRGQFELAISFAVRKEDKKAISVLFKSGAVSPASQFNSYSPGYIHPIVRALDLPHPDMLYFLFELYGNNFGREFFEWHEVFLGSAMKLHRMKNLLLYGFDPEKFIGIDVLTTIFDLVSLVLTDQNDLVMKLEYILQFVIVHDVTQKAFQCVIDRWKTESCFSSSLWSGITNQIKKPSSLKHICRLKIRRHMFDICGPAFVIRVSDLSIPPPIKAYLSFNIVCPIETLP